MTVQEQTFVRGPAIGYFDTVMGTLDPSEFANEQGSVTGFVTILLWPEGADELQVDGTNLDGLGGLWLKVGDHLAVEIDAGVSESETNRTWSIPEGSLAWADGDTVELSLWDSQPPTAPVTTTTTTTVPPKQLWTSTLSVGDDPNEDRYGFVDGSIGILNPHSYEYGSGSTARVSALYVDRVSGGRELLRISAFDASLGFDTSGLVGLWLKVSDGMAVQLGAPTFDGTGSGKWSFDIDEDSLGWSVGSDYEVSLWDSQPPGTTALTAVPVRAWRSTLTVDTDDYGAILGGTGVGFGRSASGNLSPGSYTYEPGSPGRSAVFARLLLFADDDDRLVVATESAAGASGLQGLWLKVSDDLAVELGVPQPVQGGTERRYWFFDIEEGSLSWSNGDTVEVSLWSMDPTSG